MCEDSSDCDDLISVTFNGVQLFTVKLDTFNILFKNTQLHNNDKIQEVRQNLRISISELKELCVRANFPYPLLLVDSTYAREISCNYEKRVYAGTDRTTVSIACRDKVNLADISLILRDIAHKQEVFNKIHKWDDCDVAGALCRKEYNLLSMEEKIHALKELINYDTSVIIAKSNKREAFDYLSEVLSNHHIYVSLYGRLSSPQILPKSNFSGIAVNNKKCPFLFVKTNSDNQGTDLWGRRIFTTVLLLLCLALKRNGPVAIGGFQDNSIDDDLYVMAEEFLMPRTLLSDVAISDIDELKDISNMYKVSPSAMVMRLARMNKISTDDKSAILDALEKDFDKTKGFNRSKSPERQRRELSYYSNQHYIRVISEAVLTGGIAREVAESVVCGRKGKIEASSLDGWVDIL